MAGAPASPPLHRDPSAVIVFAIGPDFETAATHEIVERCRECGVEPLVLDAATDPWFADHLKDERTRGFFPMLCVRGGLVGPLSVVRQLAAQHQLRGLLLPDTVPATPNIAFSQSAANELRSALVEPEQCIRIVVSPAFEHELTVDIRQPGDLELSLADIPVIVDADSATRADGLAVDWIDHEGTQAFRIDNPNRPEPIHFVDSAWLDNEMPKLQPLIIDARTPGEYAGGHLDLARLLDATLMDELDGCARSTPLVFYCNGGIRSRKAAERYRELGFTEIYCLKEHPRTHASASSRTSTFE